MVWILQLDSASVRLASALTTLPAIINFNPHLVAWRMLILSPVHSMTMVAPEGRTGP